MTLAASRHIRRFVSRYRLGFVAILLCSSPAVADESHYQNYIVGERALGLGGAFTAIADDASGSYYNPAGLAQLSQSSISLAAALYGVSRYGLKMDTGAPIDASDQQFIAYPATAAWVQNIRDGDRLGVGRVQMALALLTPQSGANHRRLAYSRLYSDAQGNTYPSQEISVEVSEDDSLWIGISVGWKLHPRLSFGASIYAIRRSGNYSGYNVSLTQVGGGHYGFLEQGGLKFEHWGLNAQVGLLLEVTAELRLGLRLRSPLLPITGSAEANFFTVNAEETYVPPNLKGNFIDSQPASGAIGIAYLKPQFFGVSLDFTVWGPMPGHAMVRLDTSALDPSSPVAELFATKKKTTIQVNLGGEYYIAGFVPVRAGFFTNLASTAMSGCSSVDPDCDDSNPLEDPIDRFGVTASVGVELRRFTLNFGALYNFGMRTEKTIGGFTMKTERSFLFFMLAGSFRF